MRVLEIEVNELDFQPEKNQPLKLFFAGIQFEIDSKSSALNLIFQKSSTDR